MGDGLPSSQREGCSASPSTAGHRSRSARSRERRTGVAGAGTIVFADTGNGLQAVAASGGTPTPIPGGELARWPERLPDSATVLFVTTNAIVSVSLDGSRR